MFSVWTPCCAQVHAPCDVVKTTFRPVPLSWHFCHADREGEARLLPLLSPTGKALNPALLPPSKRFDGVGGEEGPWGRWDAGGRGGLRSRTLDEIVGESARVCGVGELFHACAGWGDCSARVRGQARACHCRSLASLQPNGA